jgi:predicted GIY-YIG superfamily endonuclease
MNIYSIYKAVNKQNGKIYIGFDSSWPRRKWEHKSAFKKKNSKFYFAIRKYGLDSFEWEVIYQSKERNHTLKIMENHFITEYDSYKKGYNSTKGGDGVFGYKLTKHHISKVSKPIKINGTLYDSVTKAMNELKVSYKTIKRLEQKLPLLGRGGRRYSTCHEIMINGITYVSKSEAKRILKVGNKGLSSYLS